MEDLYNATMDYDKNLSKMPHIDRAYIRISIIDIHLNMYQYGITKRNE